MAKMTDEEFKNKASQLLNEGKEKPREKTKQEVEDEKAINLAAATLTGDVTSFLLDRVRNLGKPWAAMSEDEQNDQIHAAKDAAEHLVKKACEIIAAGGKKSMIGSLVKIAIKDKICVQIDFSKQDEQRHDLMDATGMTVSVVLADAEPFTGEREPIVAQPDQGSLLGNAEKLKKDKDKITPLKPKK